MISNTFLYYLCVFEVYVQYVFSYLFYFPGTRNGRVEVVRLDKIFYSYPKRRVLLENYENVYESGRRDAIHWNERGMGEVVGLIDSVL